MQFTQGLYDVDLVSQRRPVSELLMLHIAIHMRVVDLVCQQTPVSKLAIPSWDWLHNHALW